ncbi:asparagine synthase [Teratosphaeria destructans]|uniref:Asparagine synthase n=1 Tax=Teratosphaeria destructans TaxID=418781 RepID=A0A9W7STU4_9PEZI|nr:asparagine synthase [Teratosphaeria destructans]
MCGISCVLSLTPAIHRQQQPKAHTNGTTASTSPASTDPHRSKLDQDLRASLEQIRHRGPDATGTWISDDCRVALGHVRLSINDLSPEGAQPFHCRGEVGGVHAVVNGEFYDYDKIRAELERETEYTFTSRSDSEIIIALYLHHGLNFTSYLRGEFACVLYDEEKDLLIAVRDRYGIKPLFYTVQPSSSGNGEEKRLLIAAEMKAFLPLGWQPEWDVRSLKEGGWNFDTRTLFKDVRKIRPGHYLTVQGGDGGRIEERPYWDATFPDKHIPDPRTPEELIEGVRARMLESVRLRLRADVPVGVYLSGGIDSSVIAGMVAHLVKEQNISLGSAPPSERVTCFSIAFDEDSGFDESAIANRTAEWLGVKYLKKRMDEAEMAKRFEDAVWHCEQHNADLNFVGKYALSEVPLENGYKVVLTGEGADETFAGYPLYLPDYLREKDEAWEAHNTLPEAKREECLAEAEEPSRDHYRSIGANPGSTDLSLPRRMLNGISTVTSMTAFQPDLFAAWTDAAYPATNPEWTIAAHLPGTTREHITHTWHPLHAALHTWSTGHLPNIFLTCLGDRTEMAHSLEARTPFLDHHLTHYVNHLPPSTKLRYLPAEARFVEKWILREASKPFITPELYARRKHPYSAPTRYAAGGPLHALMRRLVSRESVEGLGFVSWEKVAGLVERAFGAEQDAASLRLVLVVAEWVVLGRRFGVGRAGGA